MRTILVTGAAGFIGYHLSLRLLAAGWRVVGLDSLNPYYDPALKRARLAQLEVRPEFVPVIGKLETPGLLADLFAAHRPARVIHLAAQAGVRHSIEAPRDYVEANLLGTYELIEATRAIEAACGRKARMRMLPMQPGDVPATGPRPGSCAT
ncbi:GDP-mannose 4,6-dehydratase [Ruegeria pomeroyi]|nr:GDP-mannose 4,6-dehydratase [Ruegeria pomeroyi]